MPYIESFNLHYNLKETQYKNHYRNSIIGDMFMYIYFIIVVVIVIGILIIGKIRMKKKRLKKREMLATRLSFSLKANKKNSP